MIVGGISDIPMRDRRIEERRTKKGRVAFLREEAGKSNMTRRDRREG